MLNTFIVDGSFLSSGTFISGIHWLILVDCYLNEIGWEVCTVQHSLHYPGNEGRAVLRYVVNGVD